MLLCVFQIEMNIQLLQPDDIEIADNAVELGKDTP